MNTKRRYLVILAALTALILVRCNLPGAAPAEPLTVPEAIYTAAAKTVMANITVAAEAAGEKATTVALTPAAVASFTATPTSLPPINTPIPQYVYPTATPIPPIVYPTANAYPVFPTAIPIPYYSYPTATPYYYVQPYVPYYPDSYTDNCDSAGFIKDVTVEDDTVFLPGESFTKIWRLINTGSCAWNRDYDVVFVGGTEMSTKEVFPIGKVVHPGQKVDIEIDLVAPTAPGHYKANFALRNDYGDVFGLGPYGTKAFYVEIRVINGATPTASNTPSATQTPAPTSSRTSTPTTAVPSNTPVPPTITAATITPATATPGFTPVVIRGKRGRP